MAITDKELKLEDCEVTELGVATLIKTPHNVEAIVLRELTHLPQFTLNELVRMQHQFSGTFIVNPFQNRISWRWDNPLQDITITPSLEIEEGGGEEVQEKIQRLQNESGMPPELFWRGIFCEFF
ncbi:MAG: hypothetical protein ACOC1K_02240 [Nanoarchaeota archaeon]